MNRLMSKEISNKLGGVFKGLIWDRQVGIKRGEDLRTGAGEIYEKCESFNLGFGEHTDASDDFLKITLFKKDKEDSRRYNLTVIFKNEVDSKIIKNKFKFYLKPNEVRLRGVGVRGYKEMKYDQQIINTLLDVLEENNAR